MFEIHCEELIRALVKRADIICGRLIAKMFRDHQEMNTRYGVPLLTLGAVDWKGVTEIQKERIMLNLFLPRVTFCGVIVSMASFTNAPRNLSMNHSL